MGALHTSSRPSTKTFVKLSIVLTFLLAVVLWETPQIHRYYRARPWNRPSQPETAVDHAGSDTAANGLPFDEVDAFSSEKDDDSYGMKLPYKPVASATESQPSWATGTASRPWPTHLSNSASGKNYTKALIAGAVSFRLPQLEYLEATFPDWDIKKYVINDQEGNYTGLFPPKNQGREAGVYLSYIVDHYHDLPEMMVFTHGERWQWHSDDPMYDTIPTIKYLNLDYVKEVGYTSLRCAHWPGCPGWLEPDLNGTDPKCWAPGCKTTPTEKFNTTRNQFPRIERAYAELFRIVFPEQEIPTRVGAPCCAQFAVSREQVLKQPLERYARLLRWVMSPGNEHTSFKVGAILEHVWHILFGRDAIYCEDASECYCKKFGLCDLTCASEEECEGRWFRITKGSMDLPIGWPVYGQGKPGLPYWGWWDDEEAVMNNTYSGPNGREFVIIPIVNATNKSAEANTAAAASAATATPVGILTAG